MPTLKEIEARKQGEVRKLELEIKNTIEMRPDLEYLEIAALYGCGEKFVRKAAKKFHMSRKPGPKSKQVVRRD